MFLQISMIFDQKMFYECCLKVVHLIGSVIRVGNGVVVSFMVVLFAKAVSGGK